MTKSNDMQFVDKIYISIWEGTIVDIICTNIGHIHI